MGTRKELIKARKAKKEARLWDHELLRWNAMNDDQLYARLQMITRIEKLRNFIKAARHFGQDYLEREGREKLRLFEAVEAA